MPIEFWTGGPFQYAHERVAQDTLISSMTRRFGNSVDPIAVAFNLSANKADIDVLVVKSDAIIIIDFKDCGSPIHATDNGSWDIRGGASLAGNPFRQVRDFRYKLKDYLFDNRDLFLRKQKAQTITKANSLLDCICSMVAISPTLPPGSKNDIDPGHRWFYLAGLDKISDTVQNITGKGLSLSGDEIRKLISEVLHCDPLLQEAKDGSGLASNESGRRAEKTTALLGGNPEQSPVEKPSSTQPGDSSEARRAGRTKPTEPDPPAPPAVPDLASAPPSRPSLTWLSSPRLLFVFAGACLLVAFFAFVAQQHSEQAKVVADTVERRPTSPETPATKKANAERRYTNAPGAPREPQAPSREAAFRGLINSNLSVSSSQPNLALLVDSSGPPTPGSINESLSGFLNGTKVRIVANLADLNALKTQGFFDDLFGGNSGFLGQAAQLSRVDYILLGKAAYSFRRQPELDPDLMTCDFSLTSRLADRTGTVIRSASFSTTGPGFAPAQALERATENAAQQLKEKLFDAIR